MGREQRFHFDQALLPGGWAVDVALLVRDGLVAAVDAGAAAPRTDAERHAIALPGLPNLHSHAFQRGMAGLAEVNLGGDDSFWSWRETMYRFVARLTPDHLHAIAAMAYAEMLETGFTRVGEFHYLHRDIGGAAFDDPAAMSLAIVEAAAETGIALTHLPVFYAHSGFGGAAAGEGQRRFLHDVDGYAALLDRLRQPIEALPDAVLGVAPHSLRAVTPEELAAVAALVGGPVHIHVAEQVKEVEDCLAWSGARPVEWLLDHAAVDARWCLVHATHMTDGEARRAAASGAVAGLCPITEANLGDGIFPAEVFLAAGGAYGVGSDSNILIDASEELRLLEYGQRLAHRRRNRLAPPGASVGDTLYRSALAGGARALGAPAALAVGNPADFVTLDADHPSLAERREGLLADGWLFAAGRQAVDGVWRRGHRLVTAGRHVDRARIAARYRRILGELLA
ncbi:MULTISPECIES: formimidoylglutamate deiminase [unclassified Sphingomonas]|uniref:formimidoylglutamate deiminase n=1 Tax=unclassified Sphingomonas TaxID=196159 RepID=UPI0006FB883D|nr:MULTISPECIES: formimidoylglutamate deiminase [unclassified Sphingomonas]KQX19224.1 N-formimino-L-glutamate deiminase [Sphingomonas sp. Root1294]KQY65426.1 N-formimino-L-glutamate deiminase [Sphingomonas sp. Root50]KRB95276.1 N-formimino-L-glutamate deiminase [Sphingomonas sp. Root720]